MKFELKTHMRDAHTDNDTLRQEGLVPAVFYGAGKDAVSIAVHYNDFVKLYKEAGETHVIDLITDQGTQSVLVHDMQQDPVSNKVIHVDFKVVEKNKAVSVTVPFEFSGTSPAVKSGAGTLTKVMHEVEVEVLPAHIPSSLIVDISSLENVGDQILLKDIPLAEGSYTVDGESVVAVISSLRDESQEEGAAEIDFSQIQVQKKGKEVTEE